MLLSSIVWVASLYHTCYKCRSTLLLCFCISGTYGCIGSHRYALDHSFFKDSCNNWLVCIVTLFSLDNRSEYEFSISIFSQCLIGFSHFFIEFREKYQNNVMWSCIFSESVSIWIEESFETLTILKKGVF